MGRFNLQEFLRKFFSYKPKPVKRPQPTSVERIDMIKDHEELRLEAYLPTPHDVWTIGWGHTATAKRGMTITVAEAERLLRKDLEWVRKVLATDVKVPLTQPQYDALASFIFNLGGSNFRSSTLLKKLNAKDYAGAADELPRWDKQRQNGKMVPLGGLTKRRKEERELFLSGTKV